MVEQVARERYRLRNAIAAKIDEHRQDMAKQSFDRLLFGAGADELVCTWSNMRNPMMLHNQPGTPGGRPYGLCTVFVPALEASFSINGQKATGKAWPRERDGRPFSTSALAFSESWTEPR